MCEVEVITVNKGTDLRFNMTFGNRLILNLIEGGAVLYGYKMNLDTPYYFENEPFSLSVVEGCKLKISGNYISYYRSEIYIPESAINMDSNKTKRSTIIVAGSSNSGRTSLIKWMINLSNLYGMNTNFVNLDPSQPLFSPTGCIGMTKVSEQIDNAGFPMVDPLLYFYGHLELEESRMELYTSQVEQIHNVISEMAEKDPEQWNSTIIDVPSSKNQINVAALKSTIQIFKPTEVIVLGDESLYKILSRQFIETKFTKMPSLPGAIALDKSVKEAVRNSYIGRYFYGNPIRPLTPIVRTYIKQEFKVQSIGTLNYISSAMLPIFSQAQSPKHTNFVGIVSMIKNSLIALLPKAEPDTTWSKNILGFYVVISLNEAEGTLEVLCPNDMPIENTTFITGSVKYIKEI